jgi:hypothetical protein
MTRPSYDDREARAAASVAQLPDGRSYGAGPGPVIQVRAPYIRASDFAGYTRASDQWMDAAARRLNPAARYIDRGYIRELSPTAPVNRFYTDPQPKEGA